MSGLKEPDQIFIPKKSYTIRPTEDEAALLNENYERLVDTDKTITFRDFFNRIVDKALSRIKTVEDVKSKEEELQEIKELKEMVKDKDDTIYHLQSRITALEEINKSLELENKRPVEESITSEEKQELLDQISKLETLNKELESSNQTLEAQLQELASNNQQLFLQGRKRYPRPMRVLLGC